MIEMTERFRFVMVPHCPVVGASMEFIRRWIFFPPIASRCSLRRRLRRVVPAAAGFPFAPFGAVGGLGRPPCGRLVARDCLVRRRL